MLKKDITGRDLLLMVQGLIYAIEVNMRLPRHRQALSDCEDMKEILDNLVRQSPQWQVIIDEVRNRCEYLGPYVDRAGAD
jgi:hypothetical protein